ncbi:MAG: DNA mismatch repair endonuclease MutL [Armatimonadota bacterium]|nr:DNA mismatch repair endonuclease MutL [Armatimonadota bacterium]
MSRIHVLPRAVAERIAAGEVADRPASVVKELIENSLDAGARTIAVEVEGVGLRLIRVSDDGEGIRPEDVPLAFERFATSKITRLEDLSTTRSFGFRGEALPSIAAVSRLTLTTRVPGEAVGVRAVAVGGTIESLTPHGSPPGTTVEVTRLFFNTPARLKFLRSLAREQALIAEVVQRAAMASPDVAFHLTLDGREAGWWPRGAAADRVADLLSGGRSGDLIPVGGGIPGGTMTGWLGRPERSRPNRTGQHLFVNRRPIQSPMLRRAVEQGYAQLLPVGRLPIFAVYLDVDPATVDVNVHPRKLEVRFRDEGHLFAAVARITRQGLLASPLIRQVAEVPPRQASLAASLAEPPGLADASLPLFPGTREAPETYSTRTGRLPALRALGQVLLAYIAADGPDGLYLIDQHAAHERVLYERILAARRRGGVHSQTLAVPLALELTPAQMTLVVGCQDMLAELGYAVESFGARTVLLRAVPAVANAAEADALLRRVVGALADDEARDDVLERLSIATACHTAIRAGDRLTGEAIETLLADLAATDDPYTCFHGRPTIVRVSRQQLEQWFLRS